MDYGLYFFGAGNVCEKYRPGEPNAYFLDDRDVLIYVHGWEAGSGGRWHRGDNPREVVGDLKQDPPPGTQMG